jgi:hypothetical protein
MSSRLAQEPGPGIFYVTSRPKPGHEQSFNEWYSQEHGPLRLSLDFILNGFRFRSDDVEPPLFLATYDASRLDGFAEDRYTKLRTHRSAREWDILESKIDFIDRRFYKHISTRGQADPPGPVTMSVIFVVKDAHAAEMHRWYEEVRLLHVLASERY